MSRPGDRDSLPKRRLHATSRQFDRITERGEQRAETPTEPWTMPSGVTEPNAAPSTRPSPA
jgi:hypothetical protein